MKILITGATGFLGSHLTKLLVREGHTVIVLIRNLSNLCRIKDIVEKIAVYNIDKCPLKQPFIDFKGIDTIIHTATKYDGIGTNLLEIIESNILFPVKLLEHAASFQVPTFINTDSFITKHNLDYKYLIHYALTKKQFYEWGKQFASAGRIQFINVKLEHIYGPFDGERKFTTQIIKSCLQNVSELELTPGHQQRDFIFIEDVINAYLVILTKGLKGLPLYKEYELGTGITTTIREFVETVHYITKSKTNLKFGALPYRENEIMESKANNEELKRLGWVYKTKVERGIRNILDVEGDKLLQGRSISP